MDIKSIYNMINYNIIIFSIAVIDSIRILGTYKNGNYYYD
jgi:hypothetical protein